MPHIIQHVIAFLCSCLCLISSRRAMKENCSSIWWGKTFCICACIVHKSYLYIKIFLVKKKIISPLKLYLLFLFIIVNFCLSLSWDELDTFFVYAVVNNLNQFNFFNWISFENQEKMNHCSCLCASYTIMIIITTKIFISIWFFLLWSYILSLLTL